MLVFQITRAHFFCNYNFGFRFPIRSAIAPHKHLFIEEVKIYWDLILRLMTIGLSRSIGTDSKVMPDESLQSQWNRLAESL
jgi:hypothetical protein